MKRHLFFIGLLIIAFHTSNYSQQIDFIRGKVIDSQTSQSVPFASVRLKKSQVGVISNADGDFRIPNRSQYLTDSLIISCIGFRRLSMPVSKLKATEINKLLLVGYTYNLKEVSITARKKRMDSKLIIARALRNIKKNFPIGPFSFVSYYRDYQKDSSSYLNLNEAIIQAFDKGFQYSPDSSKHWLLQFRKNKDFKKVKVSSFYNIPGTVHSDVSFKQMPQAYVGDHNGNELFVLFTHDAIRNFDRTTFFFIDTLMTGFLRNHTFSNPEGTFDGNELLYKINFEVKPKLAEYKYHASGSIFIQPDDYSIHRLEYSTSWYNSKMNQQIFTIEIEYGHEPTLDSKMGLKYISFNNTFLIPDTTDKHFFKIIRSGWDSKLFDDLSSDLTAAILFNKEIDSISANNKGNYDITIGGERAKIKKIRVSGSTLFLTLLNNDYDVIHDSCRINIEKLRDIYGNILNQRREVETRQYRELFVQEFIKPTEIHDSCFIKPVPLEKNCISSSILSEKFWMNTPLKTDIKEYK